jgi:hypothetical protein
VTVPTESLFIAEQCIDRQERTEEFRGRLIDCSTGRVLLHAVDHTGRTRCGCGSEEMTFRWQPWEAGYLPHLSRCRRCAELTDEGTHGEPRGDADLSAPASGVDIRAAHGTEAENHASAALRDVLAEHDLRRWMFTDLVTIDETISGGFSHPLTLSPPLLVERPALALTTFMHEQLHWMEGPGTEAAADEAARLWPDPPPLPAGGTDPRSTWIHVSVCALEYHSLAEIIGAADAAAELRQHQGYSWIYGQILDSPDRLHGFLGRHGLQTPSEPPVPRRYFGEQWWTAP